MLHTILPVGPLQCNCSIFGDETTQQAIVVDPGGDLSEINAVLARDQLKVSAIVITHGHIDHVAAAQQLRLQTGAPIYMNERDREQLALLDVQAGWLGIETPQIPEIDVPAADGGLIALNETQFHIIHTPGHTRGSLCLWIPTEKKLVAGDTLFHDSIGRTDLPGGDSRQILSSIKTRLLDLPGETAVFPGHGPATTLAHEKLHNPFLRNI